MTRLGSVLLWILISLLPVQAMGESPARVRVFTGTARNPHNHEIVYTEHHRERVTSNGVVGIETVYKDSTGVSIATRGVRLASDGYLPEYDFRDLRTGYEEGIRIEEDRTVMYRRRPGREAAEDEPVSKDGILVADAGFDRLIASNWDRLLEGQEVEALLVVPSRLRCFRILVAMVAETEIDGVPVATFRMWFSSPLLRLLAPKILVTYHSGDQTIVAYEGKSSLEDPAGGNYDVVVRYQRAEAVE